MQVNISGSHLDISEALREYVTKKLDRLDSHFEGITNVQVTLSVEKLEHKGEVSLHIRGANIHANADSGDMYATIDQLADKLNRQLSKHKEKILAKSHRPGVK